MDSTDLFVMLAGAVMVGSLIYLNINKIAQNIDIQEENKSAKFENFCSFVIFELSSIKNDEEEFSEKIEDFIRELKHISQMNSNSDESVWSQKIAALLFKVDEYLRAQNKELLADALQRKLKDEFSKI